MMRNLCIRTNFACSRIRNPASKALIIAMPAVTSDLPVIVSGATEAATHTLLFLYSWPEATAGLPPWASRRR